LDLHSNFNVLSCQPMYFEEVVKEEIWVKSMNEERDSIEKNDNWDLVDLPEWNNCIGVKWIYKTEFNEKWEIEKYKTRLVAKAFA